MRDALSRGAGKAPEREDEIEQRHDRGGVEEPVRRGDAVHRKAEEAWGGFGAGLYTVALTALGGRYSGVRLAEANAAVTMAYGLGALLSPGFFGFAMDSIAPPHGLLY
ncbi:MAG: hypothetical protein AAFV96_09280, partial [Pseudomonadota bacterium]